MKTSFRHTFYKKNYYFSMPQGMSLLLGALLLGVYIFTGIGFFGSIILIYMLCLVIYYFFKYILRPRSDTERNEAQKTQNKINQFKILLRSKNFLNHHNYFHSQKYEKKYKRYLLKKNIFSSMANSLVISGFIIIGSFSNMLSSEISILDMIAIYIGISFLLLTIIILKVLWDYVTKVRDKKTTIYQEKLQNNKKFVSYRNKIFFY